MMGSTAASFSGDGGGADIWTAKAGRCRWWWMAEAATSRSLSPSICSSLSSDLLHFASLSRSSANPTAVADMILKSLEELNPELSFKGPKIVRMRAIKQYMMIKITPWDIILEELKNEGMKTVGMCILTRLHEDSRYGHTD
ncbi:hypothetical protein C2S52_007320 [Perilla frutescens var. hirtella]|nr:hypothetical protein C2S52_007320 [Perilla frutescens var. hirtella]